MNNEKKKKNKKIKFEIKRVYVGKKPIEEVFEGVIEHIAMKNLEDTKEDKRTQA
ncbi:recombinase RecR [Streptococcus suis]|uniref:recombinase RecR n=2 Tax=Streptococcus suis TaxID=1307 RepID=UPI002A7B5841|nr:recombinase RecR [Streptococcus suis]HEL0631631.1 recombinase RecR [Streptococcus equi subsp. zooepidemicus]HEL0742102.1 recombinase RecR [Streptococcus equi subsp. zooepidemicus]HEL1075770.1 recombinase RecR [Streptococcus equi subsp. zooepidemicus]HEL1808304.1 recombinase RecR [Streptococcus suis]